MEKFNPILSTQRLYVRELSMDDCADMFEMDSDPRVHRFLSSTPVMSLKEVEKTINDIRTQYSSNGLGRWAVINKQSDRFIGWAGLKHVKGSSISRHDHFDFSFRFKPDAWGQGFASECGQAIVNHALNDLPIKKICAITHRENLGSIRILSKIGFTFVNRFSDGENLFDWYELHRENVKSEESYNLLTDFIHWL